MLSALTTCKCCINPYEKGILEDCIQTEISQKYLLIYFNYVPISPWSQWNFRLRPESWSRKKCFWASPKQWGDGLYRSIELDSHIKTMGKRRREKDPCCKTCRQLGHFNQWRKRIVRLHGVAGESLGFWSVSSCIYTEGFTVLFSFAMSQHTENSLAIFKMSNYVKYYLNNFCSKFINFQLATKMAFNREHDRAWSSANISDLIVISFVDVL